MHEHASVWVTYDSCQGAFEKYFIQFLVVLDISPQIPQSLPTPLWCVLLGLKYSEAQCNPEDVIFVTFFVVKNENSQEVA